MDKVIETSMTEMEQQRKFLNAKDEADRLRTLDTLSEVYQHALHENYFQAQDLLRRSRLKKTICDCDLSIQILYNRTMAYLGLCAFHIPNIKEAHNCLADLVVNGKLRELLASDVVLEEDILEKQHLMPIICMDISLELLECVYLVSAMLIEVPYMAAHEFDSHHRKISKSFYQQLKRSERQSFVGPPDSMREHVVAAAKAMRNGHWAACNGFIINEKMNKKVWNLLFNVDEVKAMLTRLIKEETLRVYLFTFSYVYDSISISILGDMFELETSIVYSIISKMIIKEGLTVSLDGPSQTVIVHHNKPSQLKQLAIQLTDKIDNLLDGNEQLSNTIEGKQKLQTFRGTFRGKRK